MGARPMGLMVSGDSTQEAPSAKWWRTVGRMCEPDASSCHGYAGLMADPGAKTLGEADASKS